MKSKRIPFLSLAIGLGLAASSIGAGCMSENPVSSTKHAFASPDIESGSMVGVARTSFQNVIPLPNGFQPEGIVVGRGSTFYVGSLADGSIYRGDLRSGEGEILVTPGEERIAVGLAFDGRKNLLFVAGQSSGEAYVYEAETGDEAATFQLTGGGDGTFINDVVVTRTAAYFTNSFQPEIYVVPLSPNGELPDGAAVETLSLSGEFEFVAGFNTNGIDATPNGEHLFVVNSSTGTLYRVDPQSGEALAIDLGGDSVQAGDGILLDGRTLFVVQNRLNQIAVVELSPDFTSGEVTRTITSEHFDVPTTIAEFGNDLYAVNARFGTEDPASAEYSVVRVPKR